MRRIRNKGVVFMKVFLTCFCSYLHYVLSTAVFSKNNFFYILVILSTSCNVTHSNDLKSTLLYPITGGLRDFLELYLIFLYIDDLYTLYIFQWFYINEFLRTKNQNVLQILSSITYATVKVLGEQKKHEFWETFSVFKCLELSEI